MMFGNSRKYYEFNRELHKVVARNPVVVKRRNDAFVTFKSEVRQEDLCAKSVALMRSQRQIRGRKSLWLKMISLVTCELLLHMLQYWYVDAWIPVKISSRVCRGGHDPFHPPELLLSFGLQGKQQLCLSERRIVLLESLKQDTPKTEDPSPSPQPYSMPNFKIRRCNFSELGRVADIIVESFYTNTSTMWKGLYRLAELNRLQQNFAYSDQAKTHHMLVVVVVLPTVNIQSEQDNSHRPTTTQADEIVGFCDVDARPLPPDFKVPLPRPYLSDLCIATDYRRQGLAQALVEQAEYLCTETLGSNKLWIRVQEGNNAAMALYQRLGYQIISKEIDRSSKKAFENKEMIMTLRKDFE